jgi:hypothetical protein
MHRRTWYPIRDELDALDDVMRCNAFYALGRLVRLAKNDPSGLSVAARARRRAEWRR